MKPLVGDEVEIEVLDEKSKTGNLIRILPRKNELIRPAAANVDQAIVIFAVRQPDPSYALLDRFLISMEKQKIETIICFNKIDEASLEVLNQLEEIYCSCDYKVLFTSVTLDKGIDNLKKFLKNKTTVLAGPSGVGKSSLINLIQPEANMETGCISEKIQRGKHTTRHSELFFIDGNSYIMDTPGFSSLYIDDIEKQELKAYFSEFKEYETQCRFTGCVHIKEPDCGVKQALEQKKISKIRYNNYVLLYEELKDKKRY